MAKEAIEYLEKEGISNGIVYQSKTKRLWLSDLLDIYYEHQVKSIDSSEVRIYTEKDMDNAYDKGFKDGNQRG